MTFYLDAAGDAQHQGALDVRSEADFLRSALSPQPLLIHGDKLCRWAERFAAGRAIPVRKVFSPLAEVQQLLPLLAPADAERLLAFWPEVAKDRMLRSDLAALATYLAGHPLGSAEHAAGWLFQRLKAEPESADLLTAVGSAFAEVTPKNWHPVYKAPVEALPGLLFAWLGVEEGETTWPVAFPLSLRGRVLDLVRQRLEQQVAAQGAGAFVLWQARGVSPDVLKEGAVMVAQWLVAHPESLTPTLVQRLGDSLPIQTLQKLLGELPVHLPSALPEQVNAWGKWMQREYLPYRTAPKADQAALLPTLREFAERFLKTYAQALNGGANADWLVWQKCASLQGGQAVTLVAVCDGLSLTDLVTLQRHLAQQDFTRRLSDLGSQLAFAPLPTLTSQAKPTLERGIARALSDGAAPLGIMPTQESKVRAALKQAQPGDVVFWNYLETDSLYHKAEALDQAKAKADTTLLYLAQRLLDLMLNAVPEGAPARLVITTDHGRLLLASQRSVAPPAGFSSEGRAAFGQWQDIPARGYEVRDEYALLAKDTFGMTQDVAVLWNNETFHTASGATGLTICPHGGVAPEEVLIPWAVYARDLGFRLPILEVTGKSEAEQPGTLLLRAINPNPLPLTVTAWAGSLAPLLGEPPEWTLAAGDVTEREFRLNRWPISSQLLGLNLQLTVRAGQGSPEMVSASIALETEELYTPTTSILDDLL